MPTQAYSLPKLSAPAYRNTSALLRFLILATISAAAVASRLFAVVRHESIIHEFDPWFNFRASKVLVNEGFYEFWNWFDPTAWYPLGRVVGGTVYPGLMATAGVIWNALRLVNLEVDIRNVCVMMAPAFSGLTAWSTYLFTNELEPKGQYAAGLLAAAFIGIAPGYISRSVAGSYDNEAIAIFLLMFTFYLWLRALRTGSALWGTAAALFYGYMVAAWGGYVFITNMLPLHAFVLVLMGRFTQRLYVAYSAWYLIGTLASMQVPFVGFLPLKTSEHMAALGVFGLLQLVSFVALVRQHLPARQFQTLLSVFVVGVFVLAFGALVGLTMTQKIAPWTGRFYSLWDTGYAKIHIPIIASVSEHQPTAWPSFFFDLQMMIFIFPAGIFLCFQKLSDAHVFVIIYALLASYFAGVMVRLMLTLTPVVCVAAALATSKLLKTYLDPFTPDAEGDALAAADQAATALLHETRAPTSSTETTTVGSTSALGPPAAKKGKKKAAADAAAAVGAASPPTVTAEGDVVKDLRPEAAATAAAPKTTVVKGKSAAGGRTRASRRTGIFGLGPRVLVAANVVGMLFMFVLHCTWVTSNAYSSPSVVLSTRNNDGSQNIIDDFREAYYWLRMNTEPDAVVASWWDYGYQIAGMADRPTLVDNNTWNNTHIATVGKAMSSSEEVSYPILKKHDVSYVLVIFGGLLGYSGDDINKFLWMVRIAQGVWPEEIQERDYFTPRGEYKVDGQASKAMKESLMYKMSYHRFPELFGGQRTVDRVRQQDIPESPTLDVLEEAFTTENWIVRIYKVKDLDSLGRPHKAAGAFDAGRRLKKSVSAAPASAKAKRGRQP